jgi:hypothetical protein
VWMSSGAGDCYAGCVGDWPSSWHSLRCQFRPARRHSNPIPVSFTSTLNDNAPLARTAKTIGGCWRDVRPAWPFYALPDAASLIVTLLLSIGLWAAIWEAVDLLASAVLH